ncbi:Glycosyltransferase, GT2 family [Falsiroseomonas stagni DSM 19981]|uniref:Glycosyltransferase, GT2 family n=1 Tax=Falsiroseomonas stagni DSM 19981 TaxID=1123062 RepID=A0A1I3XKV2_9PROT|nr:Glycosyltransferase, GT2 family [Falsiroseomonas stagni DSM 19981]
MDASLSRVTIVTVTWASADAMRGFMAALPPGVALIVVDNASPDGTVAAVRAARPGAVVVENGSNLGFGAGCNRGLDRVSTEFALLANPDARLTAAAIAGLVAAADRWPAARLVAPLILDGAGRPVRSWNASQLRRRRMAGRRDAEPWPEGAFCADYASGACLLLRPAEGLRFDERFFLFYEDDDICLRAGGVLVEPGVGVAHEGGRSSGGSARVTWRKAWHMAWSRLLFLDLHGGHVRAEAWRMAGRHGAKALGHAATLRGRKLVGDLGALAGTLAWIGGRRRAI